MKRKLTHTTFLLAAAMLLSAGAIKSCTNMNAKDADMLGSLTPTDEEGFVQKELGYAYDALEPVIDAQTMELHYSKHHAGYTRKFNAAVQADGISGKSMKEIFANVSQYSPGVRNNGGGYFNHALYWAIMSPDGGGEPSGALKSAIDDSFGSFEKFKELFSNAAATQFGSGWAWLVLKDDGKLVVCATQNQDNPLMDIAEVKGTPLLNIDVWEHAYYLNYQNRRTEYIEKFWNIINWDAVEDLYEQAK